MLKTHRLLGFILILFLQASCSSTHIAIRQIDLGPSTLASSAVGTPDPRQEKPIKGERLYITWAIPSDTLTENPKLVLKIIYKDFTTDHIEYVSIKSRGSRVVDLIGDLFTQKGGFFAYQALLVTEKEEILYQWNHQMWVNLLQVEGVTLGTTTK
mgnify:CR=1 FL=1